MQRRRPEPLSSLELHLAYWLHYVGNRLFHELRERSLEYGVTAAESVLLRKLHEHEKGATPSLLASELGLSRSHISRLAMRLEIKGLVERERSLTDRRARIVSLNGYGRVMLPYLAAAADRTDARSFGGTDDGPHETIDRVMKWIVRVKRWRWVPPGRCRIVYPLPEAEDCLRAYRDLKLREGDGDG